MSAALIPMVTVRVSESAIAIAASSNAAEGAAAHEPAQSRAILEGVPLTGSEPGRGEAGAGAGAPRRWRRDHRVKGIVRHLFAEVDGETTGGGVGRGVRYSPRASTSGRYTSLALLGRPQRLRDLILLPSKEKNFRPPRQRRLPFTGVIGR